MKKEKENEDQDINVLTKNKNKKVQDFVDTLKDNPKEIIAWAKREINEYEALIKILEKRLAKKHE